MKKIWLASVLILSNENRDHSDGKIAAVMAENIGEAYEKVTQKLGCDFPKNRTMVTNIGLGCEDNQELLGVWSTDPLALEWED